MMLYSAAVTAAPRGGDNQLNTFQHNADAHMIRIHTRCQHNATTDATQLDAAKL